MSGDKESELRPAKGKVSVARLAHTVLRVKRLLREEVKTRSYSGLKHDPRFWSDMLQKFDLSHCYTSQENAATRLEDQKALTSWAKEYGAGELNSFGKMAGTRQASEQTRILYEYYDLTDARINRLFNSFDANKNGKLSSDEFIVGLALQGILPHGEGEGLTELAHDVKRSKSREGGNASVRDLSGKFASSVLRRQSSSEVVATSADDAEQAADSMHVEAVFKESTNYKLMEDLFAAVDEDQDQYVNKNEFRMCVQRLKLSMLLDTAMEIDTRLALTNSEENANPTNMALIDYGPTAVAFGNYPMDKDDLESFLFGVRPQQYKMTWISVSPSRENSTCGVDPLVILRLAVKYRLHPLAIHDAMTLGEQGPQVDEYGGKFIFIILPAIRITKETETEWRECSAKRANFSRKLGAREDDLDDVEFEEIYGTTPLEIALEIQAFGMFVCAKAPYDSVISIEDGWHPFNIDYDTTPGVAASIAAERKMSARPGLFTGIIEDLADDFSFQRQGNSLTLMYTMIKTALAEVESVTGAYQTRLSWFQLQLQRQEWQLEREYIRQLLKTQRELEKLVQVIRPCSSVLKHLITLLGLDRFKAMDSDQLSEIKTYLEDSLDQFEVIVDDLVALSAVCKSYYVEYDTYQDQRMNRVLYVLTLVTTLCVPLQTMTGLYGMNFIEDSGRPSLPELTWGTTWGYGVFFWGTAIGLTVFFFCMMACCGDIVETGYARKCCIRCCPCMSCCCAKKRRRRRRRRRQQML